jgi:hypothetical protein
MLHATFTKAKGGARQRLIATGSCVDASHRISKKRPNRPGSSELVLRFEFQYLQGETSGGSH